MVPSMTQPPPLFDEALRRRRLRRAAAARAEPFLALHGAAADRLVERLEPITRGFPAALIAAPAPALYAAKLEGRFGVSAIETLDAPLEAHAGALTPGAFDLVVSALELHGANDPIAALAQARLLLKPDGLLLAALFGGESLIELRGALTAAESEIEGGLSPRVAPMGEVRALGALLQRAGFALPVADSDRLTLWHQSPLHLMREIRAVGETNALVSRRRAPLRRETLAAALARYAEDHARADGKTPATVELVTLTGWAPAATQQKPLRPGSAAARLADALGAAERSAGEKAGR